MSIQNNYIFKFTLIIILLLFSISLYSQSRADSVINMSNRDYDQKNIRLTLQFNFEKEEIKGEADLTFEPLKDDFKKLILDAGAMKISSVKLNGINLKYSQDDYNLFIDLNKV
ncbi:MAG TPA: hypothetical protein ENI61_04340 [Ignavibacteria bacterium]|nr:hypothetical protein [Ignavibacteria bacterium]